MNRFLSLEDEPLFGPTETVVEIPQECVGTWALELSLLLQGLTHSLSVRARRGGTLVLALLGDTRAKRGIVSRGETDTLKFEFARNQAEYLHAVLLRTYRDGLADVEHVHLETTLDGSAHDLTFFFGATRPPMSATDAVRLLQD